MGKQINKEKVRRNKISRLLVNWIEQTVVKHKFIMTHMWVCRKTRGKLIPRVKFTPDALLAESLFKYQGGFT